MYGPLIKGLSTLVSELNEVDKTFERGAKVAELAQRIWDESVRDLQKMEEEMKEKHKKWNDYLARTGELHPEALERFRQMRRVDQENDDRGVGEERDNDEQRQD